METTLEPKMVELIQAQKSRVRALAREGRDVRLRIHQAHDRARYDLWNEKRAVGTRARFALLAYAFLRGRPYRSVESKCSEDTCGKEYDEIELRRMADRRSSLARRIMDGGTQPMFGAHEALIAWLSVPETETRKHKREAAESAGKARREEHRKQQDRRRSAA